MPLALEPRDPLPVALAGEVVLPPISETDLDRLLKLVPTEVLMLYTAAVPIVADAEWTAARVLLFAVGLLLVPTVLYVDGRSTNQAARWPQYIARMLVFIAWANAIAWPWPAGHDWTWLRSLSVLIVPVVGGLALQGRHS